ncbi:UNVERIFIED_CONTAM: hypothetical protein ABIE34_003918 [Jeotgalibacillus campisalis]
MIYGASAAVDKYLEPLSNRNTSFGRIPLSRGRRKALAALLQRNEGHDVQI